MSDYYYFMSSLPMLRFEEAPYYSFKEFSARCREMLDASDAKAVCGLTLMPPRPADRNSVHPCLKAWYEWETELRNAAIRIRMKAARAVDGTNWQREGGGDFPWMDAAVEKVFQADGAYEQERAVQRLRWNRLDELSDGHPFDLQAVLVYGLRILILEQLARYDYAKGQEYFDGCMADAASRASENGF